MKPVPRRYYPAIALSLLLPLTSYGGSATWKLNPGSSNWNTASNWTPATIPNGSSDTATFGASNQTSVSLSQNTDLSGLVFTGSAASTFFITVGPNLILHFGGAGTTNNSGGDQIFSATANGTGAGSITFANSASAGGFCSFYTNGGAVAGTFGGTINFFDTASASGDFYNYGGAVSGAYGGSIYFAGNSGGAGSIVNYGGAVTGAYGSETRFQDSATASGFFTNHAGAVSGAYGGRTWFFGSATVANGTFSNDTSAGRDPGLTSFANNSTAGNGMFGNEGGVDSGDGGAATYFNDDSSAGSGTFINAPGATSGASGGATIFYHHSTAASGHFTNDSDPGVEGGNTDFHDNASAGSAFFTNYGGEGTADFGGYVFFSGSATANTAQFENFGGTVSGAYGAHTTFYDTTTAGSATFKNYAGDAGAFGGFTEFYNSASAGSGTFTNYGGPVANADGGATTFYGTSTAGNSTLISNNSAVAFGGHIFFLENSTGGTARAKLFGNGYLAIDSHASPNVTIGSVEGDGNVFTGANNLNVGGNNLGTSFSGFVDDGGAGGALTKGGAGVLSFENRAGNNYLSNTLTLSVASGSLINLNFAGTSDTVRSLIIGGVPQMPGLYGSVASGAPNQRSEFAGTGKILVTTFAVSRKTQGANSYDINLPLAGPAGVECRSGGAGNNYRIVVIFVGNVTYTGAAVTSGIGSVSNISGNNTSTVTIDLSGVTGPQKIVVTVNGLNDGFATANLAIPMRILVGDTTGNGSVNASDVTQVKVQSGQGISASNFRTDVSANGTINASDVSLVKTRSGQSVPP
jgi:hypothetical protein